jgi:hypothetical protein
MSSSTECISSLPVQPVCVIPLTGYSASSKATDAPAKRTLGSTAVNSSSAPGIFASFPSSIDRSMLVDQDASTALNADASALATAPWEVVCAAEVFRALKSDRRQLVHRRAAIHTIAVLAEGRWNADQRKQTRSGDSSICRLYEARVNSDVRVLWEISKDFSERHSAATATSVFTDVIRVWRIVFDHAQLSSEIDAVVKSLRKGQACRLAQYIELTSGEEEDADGCPKRQSDGCFRPRQYMPCTDSDAQRLADRDSRHFRPVGDLIEAVAAEAGVRLILPAQEGEAEFNLQKFYSLPQVVSALLAGALMPGGAPSSCIQRAVEVTDDFALIDDDDAPVATDAEADEFAGAPLDLPFRPSPLEHRLIHRNHDTSMILIGACVNVCVGVRGSNESQAVVKQVLA